MIDACKINSILNQVSKLLHSNIPQTLRHWLQLLPESVMVSWCDTESNKQHSFAMINASHIVVIHTVAVIHRIQCMDWLHPQLISTAHKLCCRWLAPSVNVYILNHMKAEEDTDIEKLHHHTMTPGLGSSVHHLRYHDAVVGKPFLSDCVLHKSM